MAKFGRKQTPMQLGERFTKAGNQHGKLWEISRLWTTLDGVPHARLKSLDKQSDTMAISVVTLADPQFFTPVPIVTPER